MIRGRSFDLDGEFAVVRRRGDATGGGERRGAALRRKSEKRGRTARRQRGDGRRATRRHGGDGREGRQRRRWSLGSMVGISTRQLMVRMMVVILGMGSSRRSSVSTR